MNESVVGSRKSVVGLAPRSSTDYELSTTDCFKRSGSALGIVSIMTAAILTSVERAGWHAFEEEAPLNGRERAVPRAILSR